MMQKKFLVSVFFILTICLCTVPVVLSMGSESGNSRIPACADLGIEVIDGLVSMDVRDAEIRCVLQEIAGKAKLKLDISDDIDGKVTISAKALSLEDVLKRLCENRAIVYQYIPEKKTCRIISVGAYSRGKSEKDKTPPTDKSSPGDNIQKQESRRPDKKLESAREEKLYDSRGRLLYKPGELLVRFKKDATEKQIADLHKRLGSSVAGGIARIRLQRVKLREGLSERDAIKAYMASGIVEVAERHALRYADATVPNDEYFGGQWGIAKIRAPEAWDITTGSSDIIIAVIDTGVDYSHPDLANNIWVNRAELEGTAGVDDDGNEYVDDIYGWDFANNDSDPIDIDGHGTHVAGIIAAEGNNSIGIAGVCWNAKIMVLKVQADGSDFMLGWDIINAMHYAINKGARIVNCSFGGEGEGMSEFDAVAEFQNADIIAVCAAGNDGTDNDFTSKYPASYELDNIIAVAASDQSDNLAGFSNYGKTSVDVMAPGEGIKSTIPDSSYGIMSGTSMAAPHVAGIAGLILSKNPGLDYSAVKSLILDTVNKIPSVSDMLVSGGRVNALAALSSVCIYGDVSGDNNVQLDDAILCLQILAGLNPEGVHSIADVNGDGKIGLPEAIYALQWIAGFYNRAPVLKPIGNKTVGEGESLSFQVVGTDSDGDDLTFMVSNLPGEAVFDSDTEVFSWTPTYSQSGTYDVTFTVTDSTGHSDSETITITVSDKIPVLNATEYFPLNVGDWLDYKHNGSIEQTKISGIKSIGTVDTRIMLYADGSKEYYTSDQEGVQLYGQYIITEDYTGDIIFETPLLLMPDNANIGTSYSSTSGFVVPGYAVFADITSTTSIVGLEDVVTENTILRDCMKVSMQVTSLTAGIEDTTYYWFYKNVGCVKQISGSDTYIITKSYVNGVNKTY